MPALLREMVILSGVRPPDIRTHETAGCANKVSEPVSYTHLDVYKRQSE